MKNKQWNPFEEAWCVLAYRRSGMNRIESIYMDTRNPIDVESYKRLDTWAGYELLPLEGATENETRIVQWPSEKKLTLITI